MRVGGNCIRLLCTYLELDLLGGEILGLQRDGLLIPVPVAGVVHHLSSIEAARHLQAHA